MSIEWAPILNVSWKRRFEVLSAFTFFMMIYFAEIICTAIFVTTLIWGGSVGRIACTSYLLYFYLDRRAHETGDRGQGNEFSRKVFFWRYLTSYFPITLVKTVDLPPTQNYLFAVFPHGIMSTGAFGNFASSTTNFHKLFPKIRSKFCTLKVHFFAPFYRDLLLSWGMISVTSSSIKNALTQSTHELDQSNLDGYTSNAVVIAVGGSQEVVYARPGDYRLVLKDRKGFVKLAIQTGAALVPVYSFGENDIFDQPENEPGSLLRIFQDFIKKFIGITPPIVQGRGFFQYSYGIIPRRCPIKTVVGAPIETIRNELPTNEEVNDLHQRFIHELNTLFDLHKHDFISNSDTKLIIN